MTSDLMLKLLNCWLPISEIPRDKAVMIYSVTGIQCRAKVQTSARINDRLLPHRIACFRRDGKGGDIIAIAWRPL